MMNIDEGFRSLTDSGLNLIAVLNCVELPERTWHFMANAGIPVADYRQLLLIGHGGRRLWRRLRAIDGEAVDPIDRYSVSLAAQFVRDCLPQCDNLLLYPHPRYAPPLQQLGEAAGWCHTSPLGLGISPVFGVWFAYRALLLIDADLPPVAATPSPSPCLRCMEKPCIDACPAGAVRLEGFDVTRCAQHRLGTDSGCTNSCPARVACPVHSEHRYSREQIRYHYRQSLVSLRQWYRSR